MASAISVLTQQPFAQTPSQSAAPAVDEKHRKIFDRINKTAKDFEAVFVTEMLKPMFDMVKVDPEFGGGKGEEVFRDFTLNEYGKKMAAQGGFGLSSHVREQMIRMQAQSEHPGASPTQLAADVKKLTAQADAASKMPAITSLD